MTSTMEESSNSAAMPPQCEIPPQQDTNNSIPTMADSAVVEEATTNDDKAVDNNIQHVVTWADGDEPHSKKSGLSSPSGTFSTTSPCSSVTHASNNNKQRRQQPLSPKFSEEGSSRAAVMDEFSRRSSSSSAPPHVLTATAAAPSSSTPATVSPLSLPFAALPSSSLPSLPYTATTTSNKEETESINMGTSVDVVPQQEATKLASVAIMQESAETPAVVAVVQEETAAAAVTLHECLSQDDEDRLVILSPAWSESTADDDHTQHRAFVISPSSSSDSSEEDGMIMSPSRNDIAHGIILPPSLSNSGGMNSSVASQNSPGVVSPSPTSLRSSRPVVMSMRMSSSMKEAETPDAVVYDEYETNFDPAAAVVVSQLISLPIDSLHCVASFLTPLEWSQYGQTCSAASKVCREIVGRVRMHGFRCATEVITSWKLEQLADAKELAALYISTGVPIYPHSLGHSYHTMVWRMGIAAKDMQEKLEADNASSSEQVNEDGEPTPVSVVDGFYDERGLRARDATNPLCSYLEDKSMYMLGPNHSNATSPMSGRWRSMTSLHANHHHHREQPLVPPAVVAAGDLAQPAAPLPDFRPRGAVSSPLSLLASPSSPVRSMSQSEMIAKRKAPKVAVPVHRHLLDQHLLGRSCVDDEHGDLKTQSVSLSADFFHPHLLSHSMSATHSRPLMQQHLTTPPRAASAPAPVTAVPDENMLEDPAFQAWAARAAATVQNRLSGAALNDAEELAELQELYSQIFAADRNATPSAAAAGEVENPLQDPAREQSLVIAPQHEPVSPQDSAAAASLENSLLSTVLPRDGYNSTLSSVDLEVYSACTANAKDKIEKGDLKRQLRGRFTFYQRRLEVLLLHGDSAGYEECMLDLWDEFFPLTAKIHHYDGHTPVPRTSSLQQFLTQPCPKEIGIVQCEIERVKISSKKRKGVSMKGRLFPTYEYRLFIKDRDHEKPTSNPPDDFEEEEDNGIRRDTVLMVAKNRGRKHIDTSGVVSLTPAAKKGANNYYLYTPQQDDVDTHFNSINETEKEVTGNNNGASQSLPAATAGSTSPMLLGRLQSNFIGTEFQIYTPKLRKDLPGKPIRRSASMSEAVSSFDEDPEYESGFSSDTGSTSRRRSRFGRLSLRRSSSHASSPSNSEFLQSSRSTSRSKQEISSVRAPRMNRRAIANSTDASPDEESGSPMNQQPFLCEEEDGVITYTANLLGSRPRIMDVCIPKLSPEGNASSVWGTYLESSEDAEDVAPYNRMLNRFKELQQRLESQNGEDNEQDQDEDIEGGPADFGLLALQNRPPWWNVELGSFVLNFRGRVSVASVKNFQLCDRNDHDHIMLQFGRIAGRHSFTMDYQYPLTAVQAFSIAISSLQSKISFG